MKLRDFALGVAVGLTLGGVAWAEHVESEGAMYIVHGTGRPYGEQPTRSLVAARGLVASALERATNPNELWAPRKGELVAIFQRTCAAKLIEGQQAP